MNGMPAPVQPIDILQQQQYQQNTWSAWLERISIWRLLLICFVAVIVANTISRVVIGAPQFDPETTATFQQAVVQNLDILAREFHMYNKILLEIFANTSVKVH